MVKNHEKETVIVDFKFYISLIRESKIPWDAFVKLLEDLTPTYDKLKELNSVLLEYLKESLDCEQDHDELDYDNFNEDIEDYQAKQDVKDEGIDSETLEQFHDDFEADEIYSEEFDQDMVDFDSENEKLEETQRTVSEAKPIEEPINSQSDFESKSNFKSKSNFEAKSDFESKSNFEAKSDFEFKEFLKQITAKSIKSLISIETKNETFKQERDANRDESIDSLTKVAFSSSTEFKKSYENIIPPSKTHKCDICNKYFSEKRSLKTHYMKLHKISKDEAQEKMNFFHSKTEIQRPASKIQCDICRKGFPNKWALKSHYLNYHQISEEESNEKVSKFTETNALICKICGKKNSSHNGLQEHMTVHTGEKHIQCNICGKRFNFSSSFNFHLKNVHSKA